MVRDCTVLLQGPLVHIPNVLTNVFNAPPKRIAAARCGFLFNLFTLILNRPSPQRVAFCTHDLKEAGTQ